MDKHNRRGKKVTVEEKIDGKMEITYKGDTLRFKEITQRPERQKEPRETIQILLRKKYIPSENHPWRRFKLHKHTNRYKQKQLTKDDT